MPSTLRGTPDSLWFRPPNRRAHGFNGRGGADETTTLPVGHIVDPPAGSTTFSGGRTACPPDAACLHVAGILHRGQLVLPGGLVELRLDAWILRERRRRRCRRGVGEGREGGGEVHGGTPEVDQKHPKTARNGLSRGLSRRWSSSLDLSRTLSESSRYRSMSENETT